MPNELRQTLEKTRFLASLAPEYLQGHAPAAQHKDGHRTPENPTYYGFPAIKKPGWKWHIPAYFFIGGMGSGAYIVATLADMFGHKEDRSLIRNGRYIALLSLIVSPILLILDLGRPERFHHMLRVIRTRSMMNVGAWALTVMGLFSAASVALQLLEDFVPRGFLRTVARPPLRLLSWLGILPAWFLGSYTALLLNATNVPLWARNRLLMGPLFFSSALSTGMAAIHLSGKLVGTLSRSSEERLKKVESLIVGTELALIGASGLVLRRLARSLLVGPLAWTFQFGTIVLGLIVPLLLDKAGPKKGWAALLSPLLTLLGGVILRFAVTNGGMQSAADPRAYFEYTRPER